MTNDRPPVGPFRNAVRVIGDVAADIALRVAAFPVILVAAVSWVLIEDRM